MRIRALSVFEGVIYHSVVVDDTSPCRPTLEVDAVVRPGDIDSGPLHLPLAEYLVMAGDAGRSCLPELRRKGRVVEHLDVPHLVFSTWTPVAVHQR